MDPVMGGTSTSSNSRWVAAGLCALAFLLSAGGTAHSQTPPTLAEALDQEGWTFTTGGSAPWFGQTVVTNDGADAAQNGELLDAEISWVQTEQLVSEDGFIAFRWKVSSEEGYDFARFFIDGVAADEISGEAEWRPTGFPVSSGIHTFRWEYSKDGSFAEGLDAAWVDQVALTTVPPPVTLSVITFPEEGLSVGVSPADLGGVGEGATPFERTFNYGETVKLTASPTSIYGDFQGWLGCDSFNGAECTLQMAASRSVTAMYGPSLEDALDQPTWTFTVSGTACWVGFPAEILGVDLALAQVTSGQTAVLETVWTFDGPGHLTFWWWGTVAFYLDDLGSPVATYDDTTTWQLRSIPVGAGAHTLRWVVDGGAAGDASAAVDEIAIAANSAPVASDAVLRTIRNAPAMITLSAADADGDSLSYRVVSPPEHGSLSGVAPDLVYQPAVDYDGPDSFAFTANDGLGDGNTATVRITVLNAYGGIFFDDFTDGAAASDWQAVTGTWSGSGKVYTASSVRKNNLARLLRFGAPQPPLGVGAVTAKVKLTATAARGGPNGMIVFAYQDPTHYRWAKITKNQVLIGQTGAIGAIGAIGGGTKKKVAKIQPLNRFGLYTVKVFPDGWVRVYKGGAPKPAVEYQFLDGGGPSVVRGGVGLAASKAKAVFDNVIVLDDPGP